MWTYNEANVDMQRANVDIQRGKCSPLQKPVAGEGNNRDEVGKKKRDEMMPITQRCPPAFPAWSISRVLITSAGVEVHADANPACNSLST
jgi:hypothetical protein